MNPLLRRLNVRGLSAREIAVLLERHIGDGSNEIHCKDACEAISRIHNEQLKANAIATHGLLTTDNNACEVVRQIIRNLRAIV